MSATIVGLRVVRGPDWKWQEQDGGDGYVGTVVDLGSEQPASTAEVLWDGGSVNLYRIGAEGAHDLRVFDSAPCGIRQEGVTCDVCNATDFAGIRWKCCVCSNYDLCTSCYMSDQHDTGHEFFRIVLRQEGRVRLPPRAGSVKCVAKGLFAGASVVRGRDWRWGDQDERSPSGVGSVVSVADFASKGVRDAVRVQWLKDALAQVYRVGYGGKVDVQCTVPGDGGSYYPAHLPAVGGSSNNGLDGSLAFAQGERVKCQVQESELKELQKGRGEWNPRMSELIGQIGVVQGFTDGGGIVVQYYGESAVYEYNPAALTKVGAFKVGDKVRIAEDAEKVKACQDGHGGWVDDMRQILGLVGEVEHVDEDGDVRVKLRIGRVTLNPVCVTAVSSGDGDEQREGSPSSPSSPSLGGAEMLQRLLGSLDASSSGGLAGMLAAAAAAAATSAAMASRASGGRSSMESRFKIGEKVRVLADLSRAMSLQEGHGGWNEAMEGSLGKVGKVSFVHDSGDLRVKVAGRHWTFNPNLLEAVTGEGDASDSSSSSESDSESKLLRMLSGGLQGLGGVGLGSRKSASGFEVGDIVSIISDLSSAKELQAGHGEWVSSMEMILGKTGKVIAAFPTGDLRVKVNGRKWTLNPACCTLAGNAEREAMAAGSSSESSSDDESDLLSKMLGGALGGVLGGGMLAGALGGRLLGGAGLGGALGGSGLLGVSDDKKLLQALMQNDASTIRDILSRSKGQANSRLAGKTPLMIAAHQGCSEEILRMLLDAGADVSCSDDDGDTPLHYAILGRSQSVVQLLVASGAQKDATNKRGHTPLHIASASRTEEPALVTLLLEQGCNPNVQDTDGDTALQCAIDKGYKAVASVLIEHPTTDLTLKNQRGFNALHQAVISNDEEAVKAIVRKQPTILEERNESGFTPLHMAAQHGQAAIAEILAKEAKASIEQLTERKETPLLLAVSHAQKDVADLLLDCGASVFAHDERGDTCLHLAVTKHQLLHGSSASTPGAKRSLELIRKLLEKGADQTCKNAKGKSAADLATGPHTRALLEQYRRQR